MFTLGVCFYHLPPRGQKPTTAMSRLALFTFFAIERSVLAPVARWVEERDRQQQQQAEKGAAAPGGGGAGSGGSGASPLRPQAD